MKDQKNQEANQSKLTSLFKKVKGIIPSSENRQHIEIYRLKSVLVTPLFGSDRVANCNIGDFVIIIDEDVYIRDWNQEKKEQFAQTTYSPLFIRLNTSLFDKIENLKFDVNK